MLEIQCILFVTILFLKGVQIKLWYDMVPATDVLAPGATTLVLELYMSMSIWVFSGLGWLAILFLLGAIAQGIFLVVVAIGLLREED